MSLAHDGYYVLKRDYAANVISYLSFHFVEIIYQVYTLLSRAMHTR
jgi:hypothetical protein